MLTDADHMSRALALAGRARGCTTPNPLVGAVIVAADGTVVGTGYHAKAGEPHAEVHALRAAGAAAAGATIYCTLEPCCHQGRTPPCVDALIAARVGRVVMAVEDPNPRVAGGGARILRDHGIQVDIGEGRAEALRQNRGFFSAMTRKRPWLIAKIATSLDGRIAAAPGVRTAISSDAANRLTHLLRAEVDAIGVGSGTVLADDPVLTARGVFRRRPLARVVFDRRLRTPPSARIFSTVDAGPVCVVTTAAIADVESARVHALEAAGATIVRAAGAGLLAALTALAELEIQVLLLEGGAALHDAAFAANLVDSVRCTIAPRTLGPAGVPWISASRLSFPSLANLRVEPCGPDVLIEGDVHRTD
jgi:diaminohydroxyphosphoribosylaminopyrimidine deaminase/5-amino-6-(5-phosphoribosylamino)uracil reductase